MKSLNNQETPIRVVAYARVSSSHEDQLNSYRNQMQFWKEYIESRENENLVFAGLYGDEGLSGTSTKKRPEFNRMIRDAQGNKFDYIFTKEVSRFARNTEDTLKYVRKLKKIGVGVYFFSDNIDTLKDKDGELRLSIMASLAQEESRKISERVKFGHARAMKEGIVFGNNRTLGYDLIDKKLEINEKEAEIVRKIFKWFVEERESLHGIVRRLEDIGVEKGKTGGKLNHSSIRRIIENEKYCGDLKQQKYYTLDYLTHEKKMNKGEMEFVIVRDSHEAIVSRELWNKAQELLNSRRKDFSKGVGYNKHPWGGKIICGNCGDKFRRKVMKNKDGSPRPIWQCTTYYNNGKKACENGSYIKEDIIEQAFMDTLKKLINDNTKRQFVENMIMALNNGLSNTCNDNETEKIQKELKQIENKRDRLVDLFMDANLDKETFERKNADLVDQENRLKEQLLAITNKQDIIEDKKMRLEKLFNRVEEIAFEQFNEKLAWDYLDKIEKHDGEMKIYLSIFNHCESINLSKYPKRVNDRNR